MGQVITIFDKRTYLGRIWHKLFKCPTFWNIKPLYHCSICGKGLRCYWDGNDITGVGTDICNKCAKEYE